ncbi:MAG TPA: hypothetical protein VED47_04920 [Burkholderiaceae bacterium]|nr:hypothetical protein [Burkholderiaceae bacterium]
MLHAWENFYIVAGSAAAQLIGLLFVMITLGARLSRSRAARGVHVFLTPTLVHFGGVLFDSLVMLAPWPSAWPACALLVAVGLAGMGYAGLVLGMLRKVDYTELGRGDRFVYAGAPAVANLLLIGGALALPFQTELGTYTIAGSVALLLFVALRDAWDLTLWIVRHQEAE